MKKRLAILVAVGAITLLSVAVFADEPGQAQTVYKPFNVIFVDGIANEREKASIRTRMTKSRVAAIRQEILTDPVLANKLRARGIQIRNIIGREQAFDGGVVFYVR